MSCVKTVSFSVVALLFVVAFVALTSLAQAQQIPCNPVYQVCVLP